GGRLSLAEKTGRFAAEAFYAKVREPATPPDAHVPPNVDGDVDFGGVHASLELAPGHVLAPVYLVRVIQVPSDVRHTLGLHMKGDTQGFSYRFEAYYQYGKQFGGTVSAYLAALRAGYTLSVPERPGIFAFAELLSG